MLFDVSYFGQGLGLVMIGWIAGMVVSVAFSIINKMSDI